MDISNPTHNNDTNSGANNEIASSNAALQGYSSQQHNLANPVNGKDNPSSSAQPLTQKFAAIQQLLGSQQANQQHLGMKRVIAMMSKGKDVEELFPFVVKNVVSKNLEVKKLVYIYLIHYAEKQQDSALLAVNHFQKDLSDKNQFIRALALRVMSSMSISLITQIIVMAIKKCCADMSPYVRKAAGLAIPKAFQLDNNLKGELLELISQLLNDNNTMVLGAAVFAHQEICPENYDLIHPHYRKLCKYLVDCDEWGQVVILNMLLRYGRAQFLSPFRDDAFRKKAFYSDSEEEDDWKEDGKEENINPVTEDLDPDHRLLLDGARPLLRTRNSSVVLAVASLYYHAAPVKEQDAIISPLLRLVRGSRENQYVVLSNIATIAKESPELLRKHLKDFYIYHADPLFIKNLKLEILSVLATEENIQEILREFKSYVRFSQKDFVKSTIDAICRVATDIPDVCEMCIHVLLKLLKSPSEAVVGQSIIAIRRLLQHNPKERSKIIKTMATLVDAIKVPEAKANIIWIIGEYYDDISEIAPDALRILARSFMEETPTVKLQTINLAAKLVMKQKDDATLEKLVQYVLQLGRYDQDYDIRDRVRLLRNVLFTDSKLHENQEKLFITEKTKPSSSSSFHDRSRFALASLSHLVNHSVEGYEPLPDFPETQPDTKKFRVTVEELRGPDTKEFNENESISSSRIEDFYGDVTDSEEDFYGDGDAGWSDDDSYTTGSTYTGTETDTEEEKDTQKNDLDAFYGTDTDSEYSTGSYTGSTGSYTGSETGSDYSTGSESPAEKKDTLIQF